MTKTTSKTGKSKGKPAGKKKNEKAQIKEVPASKTDVGARSKRALKPPKRLDEDGDE